MMSYSDSLVDESDSPNHLRAKVESAVEAISYIQAWNPSATYSGYRTVHCREVHNAITKSGFSTVLHGKINEFITFSKDLINMFLGDPIKHQYVLNRMIFEVPSVKDSLRAIEGLDTLKDTVSGESYTQLFPVVQGGAIGYFENYLKALFSSLDDTKVKKAFMLATKSGGNTNLLLLSLYCGHISSDTLWYFFRVSLFDLDFSMALTHCATKETNKEASFIHFFCDIFKDFCSSEETRPLFGVLVKRMMQKYSSFDSSALEKLTKIDKVSHLERIHLSRLVSFWFQCIMSQPASEERSERVKVFVKAFESLSNKGLLLYAFIDLMPESAFDDRVSPVDRFDAMNKVFEASEPLKKTLQNCAFKKYPAQKAGFINDPVMLRHLRAHSSLTYPEKRNFSELFVKKVFGLMPSDFDLFIGISETEVASSHAARGPDREHIIHLFNCLADINLGSYVGVNYLLRNSKKTVNFFHALNVVCFRGFEHAYKVKSLVSNIKKMANSSSESEAADSSVSWNGFGPAAAISLLASLLQEEMEQVSVSQDYSETPPGETKHPSPQEYAPSSEQSVAKSMLFPRIKECIDAQKSYSQAYGALRNYATYINRRYRQVNQGVFRCFGPVRFILQKKIAAETLLDMLPAPDALFSQDSILSARGTHRRMTYSQELSDRAFDGDDDSAVGNGVLGDVYKALGRAWKQYLNSLETTLSESQLHFPLPVKQHSVEQIAETLASRRVRHGQLDVAEQDDGLRSPLIGLGPIN